MSANNLFGFGAALPGKSGDAIEHVMVQRPFDRVLAFTGRTIDDIIDDPFARQQVLAYYKLHRWVNRQCEISELERQWSSPGWR